jgi:hypothetical protein
MIVMELTDEFPLVWIVHFIASDPADHSLVHLAVTAQESIRGPLFKPLTGA